MDPNNRVYKEVVVYYYCFREKKAKLDISCELSAQQTSSFIFSEKLKIKKKNIWEFHSLQFCQALIVLSSGISGYFDCNQRKCTFRHVRPGNTWISLHLGIVSPGFAAHPKNLASLASLRDPIGYILALNMILFSGNPNVLSSLISPQKHVVGTH